MKRNLLFACLVTLCNLTLFGQTEQHPRILHTAEQLTTDTLPQAPPPNLEVIHSNLGSKGHLYNPYGNLGVIGPACPLGDPASFIGMPFTPKSDSHVQAVRVPVQYMPHTGGNQVNLSIYSDSGGKPGSLLAGPTTVTNLPPWSLICCTLATATFTPLAVTGRVRYWVVADTPLSGIGSDLCGLWFFVVRLPVPIAINNKGTGWSIYPSGGLPELAGEVLGTIP
jgi:hypothetical protein